MVLSNSLKLLAVSLAVLAPAAALADDDHNRWNDHRASSVGHQHSDRCNHDPYPDPDYRRPNGRYELQTVSVWQPGYNERVWVDGQCRTKYRRHHSKTVCSEGYYTTRWVEGRHVQKEQWVWVEHRLPNPPPRERVVYREPGIRIEPGIKVVFTGRL